MPNCQGLGLTKKHLYDWMDAKVVLAWLRAHPWTTFMANRVAAIQEVIPADRYYYVPIDENPADLGTRGVAPSELADLRIWSGPAWLKAERDP